MKSTKWPKMSLRPFWHNTAQSIHANINHDILEMKLSWAI